MAGAFVTVQGEHQASGGRNLQFPKPRTQTCCSTNTQPYEAKNSLQYTFTVKELILKPFLKHYMTLQLIKTY
jgi:hypothetical protein